MAYFACSTIALVLFSFMLLFLTTYFSKQRKKSSSTLSAPPAVPGIPLFGNMLQLKDKKIYQTFTRWAETHGPFYSISVSAIGRFVQEFEWRLKQGQEEDSDTVTLTSLKLNPMLAILTPRN